MPVTGKLQKAYLVLVEPPANPTATPRLAQVLGQARGGGRGEIRFLVNPASYAITKSANWERKPKTGATSAATAEYTGSNPASITLELFLDHTDRDRPMVAEEVDKLLAAVVPLKSTLARKQPSPPWAVFGWGRRVALVGVVTSVSATYTLFTPDGLPLRANCSVTMEEVPTDPPPKQNPTSGALEVHRTHRVVSGDTLASVAYQAYGDPARWRDLAIANAIDDPLAVKDGTLLMLPDLEVIP